MKPGIYFADDPGVQRATRASSRRATTPTRSSAFSIRGTARLTPFSSKARSSGSTSSPRTRSKTGRFDYDAAVAGLETPDPLHAAHPAERAPTSTSRTCSPSSLVGAVAREAIEAYGDDTSARPVGTGPFLLTSYTRSSKIVLEANPGYRGKVWDFAPGDDPADKAIAARMKGKKLPQIERVEVSIMDETQSRWLAFLSGDTDLEYQLCGSIARLHDRRGRRSSPNSRGAASRLDRSVDPEITYTYFNMQDKIGDQPNPVGGFSKEKIALRRAIAMAYNVEDQIRIIRKGQAVRAQYPDSAGRRRHTIRIIATASPTRLTLPMRCSTSSATGEAPTAIARCPTVSRS